MLVVLKKVFSMKVAVWLLFLFGIIIGTATFIENDYGTQTAKALIYNAKWFEYFLLYFILILLYNIIKFKSYKSRFSVFLFHISFLIIAIGAGVTRYIGYEGIMSIREGQSSSTMVSDMKILQIDLASGEDRVHFEQPLLLSSMTKNRLSKSINIANKDVEIELINYLPSAEKQIVPDPNGKLALELMVSSDGQGGKAVNIREGESYDAGGFMITFNHSLGDISKPVFAISSVDGKFQINTAFDMKTLSMVTREEENLTKGVNPFETKKLHQFNNSAVVLKEVHDKSILRYGSASLKTVGGKPEMITLRVSVDDKSEEVNLFSYVGNRGEDKKLTLAGVDINLNMGAKVINLPFALKLIDFQLERYPGSMSPSSYASEVELTDREEGINSMPFRIYMNHVLDHRNYRFFQSSYDQDEKGTVLSVNHDPGTLPTYIGYLLLTLGMIWNLFDRKGRFQKLLAKAKKLQNIEEDTKPSIFDGLKRVIARAKKVGEIDKKMFDTTAMVMIIVSALLYTTPLQAGELPTLDDNRSKILNSYNQPEMLEQFGEIVLQSHGGRMKPIDTFAHEIVSKLSGKSSIYGVEANAIFLGMTVNPKFFQDLSMIKVGHPKIAKELGLDKSTKYASFNNFFTQDGSYRLSDQISESVRKKPLEKSAYDKELVKVDERLNIAYMVYTGSLLKIYPMPNDPSNKWLNPQEAIQQFPEKLSDMARMMTMYLFEGVSVIQQENNITTFTQAVKLINLYQHKFGDEVIPSKDMVKTEIWYNKLGLLSKLFPLYLMVGLILLMVAFANVVKPTHWIDKATKIAWVLMSIGFVMHLVGMGMRWYVAGHAPWSNAYESIVFIAGSTVVAGLILAKNSPFTLGATALLAGFTMLVAHMNFVNPEITNLVPVLKSYWLMIHVATIISGDGFLGLGSMLSLLVLILFIMRGEGKENIDRSIKEISSIAEMSLIIGLFLMTIGNFLGGVWANESWGRYWGWDAKETWAGVTILIYATVLHLRFIPKMNNPFVFNVASLWAYSSVIMTYFGVNYYLSGLHSYAAGDPVPIPMWVYYAIAGMFALTLVASTKRKMK